jgi:pimeloyl-ACP methyl ester carboxylesterase
MGSYQALLAAPVLGPATMTSGNRFIRRFIRSGSGPTMRWSDDELDVYARVLRDPGRANATSACYRSFLTRELPASLVGGYGPDDLSVPALLVMGENSPIRRMLDPQPSRNLHVERISGAGHFLPEEAAQRVLELTLEHLDGAGAP